MIPEGVKSGSLGKIYVSFTGSSLVLGLTLGPICMELYGIIVV